MNTYTVTNVEVIAVLRDRGYSDEQIENCNFEAWEAITLALKTVGEMIVLAERIDELEAERVKDQVNMH